MTPRAQTCGRPEARTRLEQADAFVVAAELVLEDTTAVANSGVAAALAILAGIAASDAACCARLRRRARGQAPEEAVALLETVEPSGTEMAKDLKEAAAEEGLGPLWRLLFCSWGGTRSR